MIDDVSNLSNEEIENELSLLWKEYSSVFNNTDKKSCADQSETLDSLLLRIRALEKLKKK